MPTAIPEPTPSRDTHFGLPLRLVLSWTMAGAIAGGGFLSAGLALIGRSHGVSPISVMLLVLVGAALGLVHGSLLALVGRPAEEDSARQCVHHLAAGSVWVIPNLAVAGLIAFWIAIGPNALALDEAGGVLTAAAGVLIGAFICVWAAREGHRALHNAFARWPERRFGVPVLLTVFAILATVFLLRRPEVWWTDIRVNALGALLLSLGITIWIAVPVTWMVLHFAHTRTGTRATTARDRGTS